MEFQSRPHPISGIRRFRHARDEDLLARALALINHPAAAARPRGVGLVSSDQLAKAMLDHLDVLDGPAAADGDLDTIAVKEPCGLARWNEGVFQRSVLKIQESKALAILVDGRAKTLARLKADTRLSPALLRLPPPAPLAAGVRLPGRGLGFGRRGRLRRRGAPASPPEHAMNLSTAVANLQRGSAALVSPLVVRRTGGRFAAAAHRRGSWLVNTGPLALELAPGLGDALAHGGTIPHFQ